MIQKSLFYSVQSTFCVIFLPIEKKIALQFSVDSGLLCKQFFQASEKSLENLGKAKKLCHNESLDLNPHQKYSTRRLPFIICNQEKHICVFFSVFSNKRKFAVSVFRLQKTNRSFRFPLVPFPFCGISETWRHGHGDMET
jgi:hypothetical protein